MQNSFLSGSFSFLIFFCIIGIAANWGLRALIRKRETAGAPPQPTLTDPYLIAYLRDGEKEALRIVTVALLDRGLLVASGAQLKTRDAAAVDLVNRPIERAVLRRYLAPGNANAIFTSAEAITACAAYRKVLELHHLMAGPQQYSRRLPLTLAAISVVLGLYIIRVANATMHGRHNFGFLIILSVVICSALWFAYRKRLTGLGEAMMEDLKQLFARLKGRANTLRAGGKTNEAALLAAVFGISALPETGFPYLSNLYPAKNKSNSNSSGCGNSSCGSSSSSCSSSSSSCSSGSSCGGGGGCGGGD
jgi:uncharacterized protein (TIGR04222 family)